jgi:hypothetical protein
MCNIFNVTFLETVNKLLPDKNFMHSQTSSNTRTQEDWFLLEITETELSKVVQRWRSKKSHLTLFIEEICALHVKTTSRIGQCINQRRHLPIHIKKSVVKPIYKNGTKEDANNYCPITLVPALSKNLENVMANQLIYFLHKYPILNVSLDLEKINPQKKQLPQLWKI